MGLAMLAVSGSLGVGVMAARKLGSQTPLSWLRDWVHGDLPIHRALEEGCRAQACLDFEAAHARLLDTLRRYPPCSAQPDFAVTTCREGGSLLFSCDLPGGYPCRTEAFDPRGHLVSREFVDYEGRFLIYGDPPTCTSQERKTLCAELALTGASGTGSRRP
jgi:hypothetical protein